MSATKDSQHGISFIYTNFYDHYKNLSQTKGIVLKSSLAPSHSAPTPAQVSIVSFEQQQSLDSWVQQSKSTSKQNLAQDLRELRESRKRFAYLLAEIEDMLKRE